MRLGFTTDSPCPQELHVLEKVVNEMAATVLGIGVNFLRSLQVGNGSDAGTQYC